MDVSGSGEVVSVRVDGDVVVIHHPRFIERDIDMSQTFAIDRANVPWLVAYLGVAFQWVEAPEPTRTAGDDVLLCFPGGHDSHPVANIHNQRCGLAYPGFASLTLDEAEAQVLVQSLKTLNA